MAIAKVDEKLKKVHFIDSEMLTPIVELIVSEAGEKVETIQLQLNIKGYEIVKTQK